MFPQESSAPHWYLYSSKLEGPVDFFPVTYQVKEQSLACCQWRNENWRSQPLTIFTHLYSVRVTSRRFLFFRMWRAFFATPSRFQLYQKMFTTHVSHTYCIFAIFFYWFSRALEWYVRHQLETWRAIKTVGLAESYRNPSSSQIKARSSSWVESLAKLSEREGVDMHSSSVSQFKVLTFLRSK